MHTSYNPFASKWRHTRELAPLRIAVSCYFMARKWASHGCPFRLELQVSRLRGRAVRALRDSKEFRGASYFPAPDVFQSLNLPENSRNPQPGAAIFLLVAGAFDDAPIKSRSRRERFAASER
jgi:hypothetical protein